MLQYIAKKASKKDTQHGAKSRRERAILCSLSSSWDVSLFVPSPLVSALLCFCSLPLYASFTVMVLNAAFPTFSFLAILFVLLPSTWHWRARNTPTLLLIFWLLVSLLPQAINAAIWYNTADDVAPIWCDVSAVLLSFAGIVLIWPRRSRRSYASAPM